MNILVVLFIIGLALMIEGSLMLIPVVCALIYHERLMPFVVPMLICLSLGFALYKLRPEKSPILSKEAFVSTGLTWIILSMTGMLPFLLSGSIDSFIDAFFETVSGLTTTGASILTDVEILPRSVLLWRSLMHWIGGMGVLVFMLALIPISGGTQMNLMKAESPGPTISKLVPKAQNSARILYLIYGAMTLLTLLFLLVFKMPVFDAICISVGCAGTGGFSVLNSGCASYTTAQQIIITISMIAFGVNFSFYYLLLTKKAKEAFCLEEVRVYFAIIAAAIVILTLNFKSAGIYSTGGEAIKEAAFHVGSVITTTGFALDDMNHWPILSRCIIILLMLLGACAGSTGGGLKVIRPLILVKGFVREMKGLIHPGMVRKIHLDGKTVEESVLRSTGVYFFSYMFLMMLSVLLVSCNGFDFETTVSSVVSAFNNIGPGFGVCGSCGNYSSFSDFSKIVLSADMLIGRLEIYPIVALFARSTWQKF